MVQRLEFKRIVLGLPYNRPDSGARMAAEMARLLQLDLFGLFVEEESLRGLAALPFVREFRPLGGGWRPLDIDQLSRDLEIAAKNAERAFTEAAKTLQTRCQFEIVRGSMVDTIASILRANDIVLIVEPTNVAERATPYFLALLDAAFRSAAAVLLVPRQISRLTGAIVAIVRGPDDASIQSASAIATAAKENLIVIETSTDKSRIIENDLPAGTRIIRVSAVQGWQVNGPTIASALRHVRERLVVMTRNDNSVPLDIASLRRVPVLIIEPAEDKTASVHSSQSTT
jgi:hypothetical protein